MASENRSVVLEEHVDSEYEPTEQEILDYAEWLGMDAESDQELMWIARAGLKVPLPAPWKPCTTGEENEVFYFNFETGESVWDHPCDEFHRLLYKRERAKKLGEDFDEAELEEVAERLGLSTQREGDPLEESGSLGQSGGTLSLSGEGDGKKKKKKKEKKEKKPKKEESRLEAPKTLAPLAPLSARGIGKLAELPSPGIEEAPSSESKMSSRVPSQSILSEVEQSEEPVRMAPPAAVRSGAEATAVPRPTAGSPLPPSGEPPPSLQGAEGGAGRAEAQAGLKEDKVKLEDQFEKSMAAMQAEHKMKLAKHRFELEKEFELERDRTFAELQEKHEMQVRTEKARLQQELASQNGKTKVEIEQLLKSEESLQKKLQESQAEATRLRSEAASTSRKCSAYEERVTRLEEDLKTLRKEAASKTADAEVESLKAQLERKNEEIEQIKGEAAANADRLAKWEEEMQQLQRVATEHDEAKGHIERLTEELQASKVHCSDLEKELEEKGTADASQQVEELQSLKTKLSSAEGSLKTEIEAKKKLATEISDLQSQLAKASGNKAQMEELRRELTERNKDLAEARETAAAARGTCAEEVENASKALDEQRRMATEASQRLDDAQRELASLKAQVSQQIAAKAEEECRWQQQITTEKSLQKGLQAEVDELKKQLASAKESNNQQEQRTQERLEQAQREVDQLKVDLSRHDDEKQVDEKSTAKLKVEVATLKAELDTWRAECRRLSEASQTEVPKMQALLEEEKVAASRAKAEAIEGLAQLKAQAAATAAELEARSKECGRLRAEVAARPNSKLLQDEVRELVALRAKVLELEAEAGALRQVQSNATDPDEHKIRSMIKDRDDTILRLRADLLHAATRHAQELEELQNKVSEARQEERQRKADENSSISGDLKAQLRAKASEVEQLHSEVRACRSELERVRAEARHAEARASAREISNIEAAKAAVADDWRKDVDRLQAELQSRSADVTAAKEKAERLGREVRRVQQEESRCAKGHEALRGELEEAQESNAVLRDEVTDAERRCEDARAATRAERSARAHAESQVRECQRELRVIKSQLQEQVADAEVLRNEARKQRFATEDKEAEAVRWQEQARAIQKELKQFGRRQAAWPQDTLKTDNLMATGLRTAVELSQLSEQEETLQPGSEAGIEDDDIDGVPQTGTLEDEEAHGHLIAAPREAQLEMPDDQRDDYQADAPRTPVDRGNASPVECFSPQAMAVLEARRKELDHERLTVEELRRQLKQDVHRLRSVGMTREQALLQEAGVALDSRVSALNRALAEHRVIHQTLQGSLEQIRSKAHGDTGGDATPVTGVGATAGRHERYEIPFKTEDLGLLQRWQRILGHELGEPSRRTKSPHSRARGARSNSPLSSRRSRSYREAVDHHLNWLQNFSRQAGPLTARNYSGW